MLYVPLGNVLKRKTEVAKMKQRKVVKVKY